MPLIMEYFFRKRLAEIGYTSDIGQPSAWKAEAFGLISIQIDSLKAEAMKKATKKKARR